MLYSLLWQLAKLCQLLLSDKLRHYIDLYADEKVSGDRHNRITLNKMFNQMTILVLRKVDHCIKSGRIVLHNKDHQRDLKYQK